MSRRSLILLRWGIFLLACGFLYARFARAGAGFSLTALGDALCALDATVVLGLLGLMLLNWGIESRKWRVLMHEVEPIAPLRAFAATLAGTSIGLITPNRVGEFVGRVLFLAPEHRVAGSFATALGSIAQFIVTIVFGLLGVAAFLVRGEMQGAPWISAAWIGACALVVAAALLLYFNPAFLRAVAARLPLIRRWEQHGAVLERFGPAKLTRVLLLSAGRYGVFTLQFAWLLRELAGIPGAVSMAAVPAAFLLSTLIPTMMLTELGVRGSIAVALIAQTPGQEQPVFLASALLWAINLALPAVAGSILMLTARIRAARA